MRCNPSSSQMHRESHNSDKEGEAEQAGDVLSSEMGREDHGMIVPFLPPHACLGPADKGTWSSRKVPQENSTGGSK